MLKLSLIFSLFFLSFTASSKTFEERVRLYTIASCYQLYAIEKNDFEVWRWRILFDTVKGGRKDINHAKSLLPTSNDDINIIKEICEKEYEEIKININK